MDPQRYLDCLASDFARLRTVASTALDAPVPTCSPWTVADLLRHVAEVYLHKAGAISLGEWPQPWPPDLSGEDPIAVLDRGYETLLAQFGSRSASEQAVTWFPPDQTVGFWIRRMAQETVIHRIDAELAAGVPSASVPEDLAVDGIDEVLHRFLAFASQQFREDFGGSLDTLEGRRVKVETGGNSWTVHLDPEAITVDTADADTVVRADPEPLLRWLWRRADEDTVSIEGDEKAVAAMYFVLKGATQ